MKKILSLLTLLVLCATGAWADDFTVTIDQFRTTPITGVVKIDNSNLGLSGGKLTLSSGTKTFTVSSLNANYKIKSFTMTGLKMKDISSAQGTFSTATLSSSAETTFSPTGGTPVDEVTVSITANGGTANITKLVVTLTTTTSEVLEELFSTGLTDGVF